MRVAYMQSVGGASGDMILGALVDLGLPMDVLNTELAKLGITGYEITAGPDTRKEVRGTKLNVSIENPIRHSPQALLGIVASSGLSEGVKTQAKRVLESLWRAESRVHGETEEALELEELGSVDTLVDVVGAAIGLEYLQVERVYASPLVLGASEPPRWPGGYPNPAPATLELVGMAGAPIAADRPMYQGAGELTTPNRCSQIKRVRHDHRPLHLPHHRHSYHCLHFY